MAQKSLFDFAKKPKAKPKKAKPIPVSLEAPSVVILETEKKEMEQYLKKEPTETFKIGDMIQLN